VDSSRPARATRQAGARPTGSRALGGGYRRAIRPARIPLVSLLIVSLAAGAWQLSAARPGAAQPPANPCAQAPAPGDSQISLLSSGVQRTAILHVPPAAAGEHLPVLIGLHGAGGKFFERYSGFSVLADAEHFIAVYPNPIELRGGHTFWNIDDARPGGGPDDVQFISDLIDYVEGDLCVDSSRVYEAGVSNGGGMATRAACRLSSRIAAFASIAGGYRALPPCRPTNPVSVIEVHGTSDGVVPYNGLPPNRGGAVRPWLAAWRIHDSCHGGASVRRIAPRVERYVWAHCADGSEVEHIEIYGGAHQLPGGLPPDRGQASTVSASWLAWSFLSRQSLPTGAVTAPPPG
jgi:polyhydroxybutyrate depolymerase